MSLVRKGKPSPFPATLVLMAILDLQKRITTATKNALSARNLDLFKCLPFICNYNQVEPTGSLCCFNHTIGLPKKNGEQLPLFDYELDFFNALQEHKLIWCLKSTGLGITEFMIRYISWLCLKDDTLKDSQIVIVTGPRLDLSISIIERMKHLFIDSNLLTFDTKNTVIILNGVHIQAYPSDHLDDARGIPNVSFFYADEADFFQPKEQNNLRDVAERYIAKSNPYIILVSTLNISALLGYYPSLHLLG